VTFGIEVRQEDGCAIVAVRGEVDTVSAPRVQKAISAVVKEGHLCIVVDLNDVDFLDSSGLGVLVAARRSIREQGGDLRVVCAVPRLLQVFRITKLDAVFSLHESVGAATAAAGAWRDSGDVT
jgi:anti-sigma B factor antagonist